MRKTLAFALFAFAVLLALPALALDPRCESKPEHPSCQDDGEVPPEPTTTTLPPSDVAGTVGVIGCSNTFHAVSGYLDASTEDLLANTAYAGHTMTVWATDPLAWDEHYLPQRPGAGFEAAWLNLCERASSGLTKENVEIVLAKIWEIDPDIPVWISPLNFYETEDCVVTDGNQIPDEGAAIAEALVAAYPNIHLGPELGPLTPEMLRRDACHQNASGIAFNGEQLVEFFDQGLSLLVN